MTITVQETSQEHLVKLAGDFDVSQAEEAREVFGKLVTVAQKKVVLDLSNVSFIDSSGIGAIVFLYKRLRCGGLDLALLNPQEQPYELLKLLRIDKIIDVKLKTN
jgi:anti-anti-sigma factor